MTERAGILCGVFLLSGSLYAQAPPCEDRDLDGYVAGPGCAVQEDCNDADSKVFPGTAEVCNGWDDDCDGDLDEGCNRTCADFAQTRRVTIFSPAANAEIAAADRSWAYIYWDESTELVFPKSVTRLDLRGERLVADRLYVDRALNHEIVWTGSEMVSSWDGSAGPSSDYGLYIRTLGPWGKPPRETRRLSAHDQYHYDLLWNGYEFAMLSSNRTSNATEMRRLGPEPDAPLEVAIVDPQRHYSNALTWNGEGFGWASQRDTPFTQDVFFEVLDRLGTPYGATIQVSDHSAQPAAYGAAPKARSMGPGQGYGICWSDTRNGKREKWCAILDGSGAVLDPPGEFQASFAQTEVGQIHDLDWNGQEFLLLWTNLDESLVNLGRLAATRISADGQVLEWRNVTTGPRDDDARVAWNGRSWGVSFEEWPTYPTGDPAVSFLEIGCNCSTDGDGDGTFPCGGGDCDDGDNAVGTGKPELCTDGKDNDCDGLTDCNDVDCHQNGNAPTAIGGFAFGGDKTGFSWNADVRATRYDVARGEISDLRDMENFRWTGCLHSHMTGTTASDPEDPAPGRGFYYVVRGTAKTCLLGTWGTPERDATLAGCP